MTASPTVSVVTDCPEWCRVKHRAGVTFHARCAGEVRWTRGSVVVVVTQREGSDGVELAYHAAGKAPAIAFLNQADVRQLRDSLNGALNALGAA